MSRTGDQFGTADKLGWWAGGLKQSHEGLNQPEQLACRSTAPAR